MVNEGSWRERNHRQYNIKAVKSRTGRRREWGRGRVRESGRERERVTTVKCRAEHFRECPGGQAMLAEREKQI